MSVGYLVILRDGLVRALEFESIGAAQSAIPIWKDLYPGAFFTAVSAKCAKNAVKQARGKMKRRT